MNLFTFYLKTAPPPSFPPPSRFSHSEGVKSRDLATSNRNKNNYEYSMKKYKKSIRKSFKKKNSGNESKVFIIISFRWIHPNT